MEIFKCEAWVTTVSCILLVNISLYKSFEERCDRKTHSHSHICVCVCVCVLTQANFTYMVYEGALTCNLQLSLVDYKKVMLGILINLYVAVVVSKIY